MKYLKNYENINESSFLTKAKIYIICKKYDIENYTVNSDGSIDADDIHLSNVGLTKLPLKFRNVSGYFHCNNNKLTSLEGSPNQVGNFYCYYNYLTSLEGGPKHVGGDYDCTRNNLTSLEGSPTHVGENFYCEYNNITSFEGFPSHIGGAFNCVYNPVYQVWNLFRDKSKIELFNDYDIIRGKDIAIDRLNDFLITIGKDPVKSVTGYNNI